MDLKAPWKTDSSPIFAYQYSTSNLPRSPLRLRKNYQRAFTIPTGVTYQRKRASMCVAACNVGSPVDLFYVRHCVLMYDASVVRNIHVSQKKKTQLKISPDQSSEVVASLSMLRL